ncbi:DUF979 domain-containing protein [Horticoccus luteus]|uniref:DUF979 domain-containing protein n=1 Tax=Horticoccus luteus TaxID=2862869 RepID=A0A8F9TW34_9BACT|nr:DUF979 domain-containing protein [Horticoccus luteus]QYM80160.1 DUF979 domain-containing protein [Horticoccus luteus]
MTLLTFETFYALCGVILLLVAGRIVRDPAHPRRWSSAAFWAVLGVTFLAGKWLAPLVVGYLVLVLVVLAATGRVMSGRERQPAPMERAEEARRLGNRVFWPALAIPATAVIGTLTLAHVRWGSVQLADAKQVTLVALGLGAVIALGLALRVTRARWGEPVEEGSRLLQTIGWTLILPQLLAALGGIFSRSGVGEVVAGLVASALPTQVPFVAVLAYCGGMALFTICMGNAFAAFAVITGGIGLPLVVRQHGGDPAIMASIGMLSGYCGTLLTPMAANFNIVPAMLLELRDRHAVIRAQAPMAVVIFAANVVLMWLCVYRF